MPPPPQTASCASAAAPAQTGAQTSLQASAQAPALQTRSAPALQTRAQASQTLIEQKKRGAALWTKPYRKYRLVKCRRLVPGGSDKLGDKIFIPNILVSGITAVPQNSLHPETKFVLTGQEKKR